MDKEDNGNPSSLAMRMALSGIRLRFPSVSQITTHDFYSIWQNNNHSSLLLIDIRYNYEHDVSRIPGSVWFNYDDSMDHNTSKLLELIKNKELSSGNPLNVVAYCSVGYRSSQLIQSFQNMVSESRSDLQHSCKYFNLEGSIFKWANENRPLVSKEGASTKFAHPFNSIWGRLLKENLRKTD